MVYRQRTSSCSYSPARLSVVAEGMLAAWRDVTKMRRTNTRPVWRLTACELWRPNGACGKVILTTGKKGLGGKRRARLRSLSGLSWINRRTIKAVRRGVVDTGNGYDRAENCLLSLMLSLLLWRRCAAAGWSIPRCRLCVSENCETCSRSAVGQFARLLTTAALQCNSST